MPRKRRNQPVQVASGRGYGQRQAAEQAQRVIPLPNAAVQPAPPPVDAQTAIAAAQAQPGFEGLLTRPTERPDEPVTAGAALGPGPGPEVLAQGDPDLAQLRSYLPALELMANQPNASVATRNLVRRLRGAVPPL